MNEEILRAAHPHIRQEWERLTGELDSLSAGIRSATEAFLAAGGPELVVLDGPTPGGGARVMDWEDYFIVQGTKALYGAKAAQTEPTLPLFDAVAAA